MHEANSSTNVDLQARQDNFTTPIEEEIESQEEIFQQIPQKSTESYSKKQLNEADAILTGGDIDANYEQANAVGDEAVGGTAATPDQDIVDELGAAVGLEMGDSEALLQADREMLHTEEILTSRDENRWEFDPESSEDYPERN